MEDFLAGGSVGVAPYDTDIESFTRYADPSKLRAYAAAGLPTVLTDVPPNAAEFAREAGGEVVPFNAEALSQAIERALSPVQWTQRRATALAYARRYNWSDILNGVFAKVGLRAAG